MGGPDKSRVTGLERPNPAPEFVKSVWCIEFAEDRAWDKMAFSAGHGRGYGVLPDMLGELILDGRRPTATPRRSATAESSTLARVAPLGADQWGRRGAHRSGKPWQNGAADSLVATLRRKCLDAETFATLDVARILAGRWRRIYNEVRSISTSRTERQTRDDAKRSKFLGALTGRA